LPKLLHLRQVHLLQARSLTGCLMLHGLETIAEFLCGASQCRFGIDIQKARQIHDEKEQVPYLSFDAFPELARDRLFPRTGICSTRLDRTRQFFDVVLKFGDLLVEFFEDAGNLRPVKADRRCLST